MGVRKWMAIAASAVTLAGGLLVAGAAPASADQVWIQSFERASADAPCPAPADETPWQEAWGPDKIWQPTWEEWANNGKGGWTCTRSIRWALDGVTGLGCVQVTTIPEYVNFNGGWFHALGDPAYADADCSGPGFSSLSVVYAPAPYDASARCTEGAGVPSVASRVVDSLLPDFYICTAV